MAQCTCKLCKCEEKSCGNESDEERFFWGRQAEIIMALQSEVYYALRAHRLGTIDAREVESLASAAKTLGDAWLQAEGWTG